MLEFSSCSCIGTVTAYLGSIWIHVYVQLAGCRSRPRLRSDKELQVLLVPKDPGLNASELYTLAQRVAMQLWPFRAMASLDPSPSLFIASGLASLAERQSQRSLRSQVPGHSDLYYDHLIA